MTGRRRVPVFRAAILAVSSVIGCAVVGRDALLSSAAIKSAAAGSGPVSNAETRFNSAFALSVQGEVDPNLLDRARDVLRQEPLTAEAVMLLAEAKGVKGGDAASIAGLDLAERIDKRSAVIQIALVERAVAADDIKAALVHYDRAMTVHQETTQIFFPVLKQAVADPAIRTALVPYVVADRSWSVPLLQYMIGNVPPPTVESFFRQFGGGARVPSARPLESELLKRLVEAGEVDRAQSYALTMRRGEASGLSAFGLNRDTIDPSFGPFAWNSAGEGGVDADADANGELRVSVTSGARGVVASRLFDVGSPASILTFVTDNGDDQPLSLRWTARCPGGGQYWEEEITLSRGRRSHRLQVKPSLGCRIARFELLIDGSQVAFDTRFTMSALTLRRA